MIGLFNRKQPIKVKHDELEIRPFEPKKDNWVEVRNMAFASYKELITEVINDFMFHPILSSILAILAGVLYQMKGSLWNPFIFLVVLYPTLYFFLVWKIPILEMSKQVDYDKFVEYWIQPNHPLWLLFHKGKLIGSAGLKELDVNTRGELVRVYIAPEYRHNGLGEILVYTVIDYCEKHKYDELTLATSVLQTAAMKLYEKIGFKQYKPYTAYYLKPILSVEENMYNMTFPRK
ncbi:unnamed protein product [Owenia fusiformis]|uniref:N-acetyltransferase domain-containing protein n=1 Tax=Owenia fusiformis TaxID=6347 RepID=A0A8J1XY73_OWEFU|nr:unnamed protein product [Owenia fusiformis]